MIWETLMCVYWQLSAVWSWRRQKEEEINLQICQEWMLPGRCQVFMLLIFYRRRAEEAENILSVAISSWMNEVARSCRWRSGCGRLSPCLIRLCVGVGSYAGRPWQMDPVRFRAEDSGSHLWCFQLIYPINPQGLTLYHWSFLSRGWQRDGVSIHLHHR